MLGPLYWWYLKKSGHDSRSIIRIMIRDTIITLLIILFLGLLVLLVK
ncbi:MAG: hypothetical protein Q7S37_03850 [bacterium]|nr:hypothetical protein [bacterium]